MRIVNDRFPQRQRGAALLLIMLAVLVAGTAVLVSKLTSSNLNSLKLGKTQDSLAMSRQALLDYAAVQPDLALGQAASLPCPDINDALGLAEGVAHTANCGATGTTVMGRFPWRTLGVEPPKDGSATCLWYVVSGGWKDAGPTTAAMINSDSNGQLQLWGVEAANVIEGNQPDERPVAMLIAPMMPLQGQQRSADASRQCSDSFAAGNFLDTDSGSGIANSSLGGTADGIDVFAVVAGTSETHNDRIATISRADLEAVLTMRADFETGLDALGITLAQCLADYARRNAGGLNDKRLPWPAPMALADYRVDGMYDDVNVGVISGRLPDLVNDSNVLTGNPTSNALGACDSATVVAWTPGMQNLWRNWKDHFFYVIAESHAPDAATPSVCSNCLTVNGGGQYVGVVMFANSRLTALAQLRNAPPTDIDTRSDIDNYLEEANAAGFPYAGGGLDLVSQAASTTFNDRLYCIDETLAVSQC